MTAKSKKVEKVLVVRSDRIGDTVLSSVAMQALKDQGYDPVFLIDEAVFPVFESTFLPEELLVVSKKDKNLSGAKNLSQKLRDKFSAVIFLNADKWVSLSCFFAKIPVRVGPYSKWFSYLLYNQGLRQNRSRAIKNEKDYGLDLVSFFLQKQIDQNKYYPFLVPDRKLRAEVLEELRREKIQSPFVLVHPGMGGSALNISTSMYAQLISGLIDKGTKVILSGSEKDWPVIQEIKEKIGPNNCLSTRVSESTPEALKKYLALMSLSSVVVAPSTGPLHMAAAVGTKTVSFYPPIRVQSKLRWGPQSKLATVFTPDVKCKETFHCAGARCKDYYCMDKIDPKQVILEILSGAESQNEKPSEISANTPSI
ncbi:MAG: glycosyltransferase family 9 protein [Bacteriovoracia bacterium]